MFAYTPDGDLKDKLLKLGEVPSLALEGGNLFSGHDWIEGSVVVIEQGRITQFGPAATVSIPADAQRISLEGQWLLPGLVDCWVHLIGDRDDQDSIDFHRFGSDLGPVVRLYRAVHDAHQLLSGGITAVAYLGGCEAEYISGLREAIDQGLVAGPTILTAGRALSPTSGGEEWAEVRNGSEAFRKVVREILVEGADVGLPPRQTVLRPSHYNRRRHMLLMLLLTDTVPTDRTPLSDEEFDVIVNESHCIGAKVACRAVGLQPSKAALRAGVDLLVLGPTELDAECLDMLASGRTAWAPALSTRTKLGIESDALKSAVKDVHARGGRIVVGTGWQGSGQYPFSTEVSALMEAGMPPSATLAAGTTMGAQLLDLGSASLQPGQKVSLVALDSDPCKEPGILSDPNHVSLIAH